MTRAIPGAVLLLAMVVVPTGWSQQRVWSPRQVSAAAPARGFAASAFDSARNALVVFGGSTTEPPYTPSADTFEWDGTRWTRRVPVNSPPSRMSHAMAYDERRQQVVLFGGSGVAGPLGDTWVWDGTGWIQRFPANAPAARAHHAMAYDKQRQRVVLFSGSNLSSWPGYQDTWEWDGANWTLRSPPTQPTPRDFHAMAVLPTLFAGYGGVLDPFGASAASITIPRIAALVGVALHTAFITLDAAAPLGIRSVSNTFSVVIAP